jgi:predicted nucleic acid-binding Zn ribbon protein
MSDEKMAFAWGTAVGEQLARATRVQLTARGVLQVVAADERWCKELRRSSPLIVQRLEALLGTGVVSQLHIVSKLLASSSPNPQASIPNPRSHTPDPESRVKD